MIASRRCARPTRPSAEIQAPTPSGPRCGITSRMRVSSDSHTGGAAKWNAPAMPHISAPPCWRQSQTSRYPSRDRLFDLQADARGLELLLERNRPRATPNGAAKRPQLLAVSLVLQTFFEAGAPRAVELEPAVIVE